MLRRSSHSVNLNHLLLLIRIKIRNNGNKIIVIVSLTILILMLSLIKKDKKVQDSLYPATNFYLSQKWNDGLTLKDISDNSDLRKFSSKNIFFHVTTYIQDGVIKLTPRQACAIESTALMNPDYKIFVLFASQVGYRNKTELRLVDAILSFPNVYINFLNITRYVEDTPLEKVVTSGKLFRSKYVISHTSDVLRYASLWKYSGTYLDLDIVALKSLNELKSINCVGAESNQVIAVGLIHFEGTQGSKVSDLCIRDLAENFSETDWASNGPGVMTRTAEKLCGTDNIPSMIYRPNCMYNFRVLSPEIFYSIYYTEYEKFFHEEYAEEVLARLKNSVIAHVWNALSDKLRLSLDSNAAYIQLARKYCPRSLAVVDEF